MNDESRLRCQLNRIRYYLGFFPKMRGGGLHSLENSRVMKPSEESYLSKKNSLSSDTLGCLACGNV